MENSRHVQQGKTKSAVRSIQAELQLDFAKACHLSSPPAALGDSERKRRVSVLDNSRTYVRVYGNSNVPSATVSPKTNRYQTALAAR